jgi:transposase InsO family protein
VGISRTAYYYKSKKMKPEDMKLQDIINDIALEFPYYCYRRVTAALKRKGLIINHKKVHRIMKDNNILCKIKRSFKKTTNSAHSYKKYNTTMHQPGMAC